MTFLYTPSDPTKSSISETYTYISTDPASSRNLFLMLSASNLVKVSAPPAITFMPAATTPGATPTFYWATDPDPTGAGQVTETEIIGDPAAGPPTFPNGPTGVNALLQLTDQIFNILCIPTPVGSVTDLTSNIVSTALPLCVARRTMFIMDPPSGWTTINAVLNSTTGILGTSFPITGDLAANSAIYFPRISRPDPTNNNMVTNFAPSGAVAGIYALTDSQRGVWKAPAGIDASLNNVPDFQVVMSDDQNGQLNPLGVNCLRAFPIYGRVVWGARTLQGADQLTSQWKYVPVRRTALYIEESLFRGLKWAVFEPNDEPLWAAIRLNVGAFMQNLFRQGAFQGSSPQQAYFVKCDDETTTQNDIDLGIVNVVVGFAPSSRPNSSSSRSSRSPDRCRPDIPPS